MDEPTAGATSAPEASAPDAAPAAVSPETTPTETPTATPPEATTDGDGSSPVAPATGDEPVPSQTDAAATDAASGEPVGDAGDDPYAAFLALPVHEQAKLLGAPEGLVRDGHVYFDEAEGHGKFKDWQSFFDSRQRNDSYANSFREVETRLTSQLQEAEAKREAAEARYGQQASILEALTGKDLAPDGSDLVDKLAPQLAKAKLPEDLRDVDPSDLDSDEARSDYYTKLGIAQAEVRREFADRQAKADAEKQAQIDAAERGAEWVKKNLTPEALGATTIQEKEALASILGGTTTRADGEEVPLAAVYTDLAAYYPGLAQDLAFAHKVRGFQLAGQDVLAQQQTNGNGTPEAPASPAPGGTPTPTPEPVNVTVTSTSAAPSPPSAPIKKSLADMSSRELIQEGLREQAARQRR